MFEKNRLTLEKDGAAWPNRDASRIVEAAGLRWHVQVMGEGPVMLLLHGTSASTHSWRALMPLLARSYTLVVPDLPGHGFSGPAGREHLTLNGMSKSLAALLKALDVDPAYAVGHSAGAAVALWSAMGGMIRPRGIVSINGALYPFRGLAGRLFPTVAKLLFVNPWTPRLFASNASRDSIERLISQTGSALDDDGIDLYLTLIQNPGHVAAALGMMANWDLNPLIRQLPNCETPLHLIVGERDEAVPPDDADKAAKLVPGAVVHRFDDLGHLAHEEDPVRIAALIGTICTHDPD